MAINTDFHSHVSYSSAYEMAQTARERGLRTLGLSEHIFQMRETRPLLKHMPTEGPLLTFASYVEQVQAAARDLQFDVRLGLEVDFIPDKNAEIQDALQSYPWDFLIGSVHEIDGTLFERNPRWTHEQGEEFWLRYFKLLREAVTSGYFSLISHPVRMRICNPYLPPTLDEELEQVAAEAARCDVALEINGFDVAHYPDLVRRLARACALQRTPISVSSDAHRPREIAQSHVPSETILHEAGISTVRIWRQRQAEEYAIEGVAG
ncbi:MAG: PHP domain-containing protein [Ktedonobacteraceae bacterium]